MLACGANESAQPAAPTESAPTEPAQPAQPAEPAEPVEPTQPAQDLPVYLQCAADADCVVGRNECSHEVGVRADQADAYETQMAELRPSADCEPSIGARHGFGETVAYCLEGECRGGNSAYRCSNDTDCAVVGGACGTVDVIGREFETQLKELFDRIASVASCGRPTPAPPLAPQCREGLCVGRDVGNGEFRMGCRRPSDCVVLTDPGCGDYLVVHRRKRRQAEAYLQNIAATEDCEPAEPTPEPEAACINRYCMRAP